VERRLDTRALWLAHLPGPRMAKENELSMRHKLDMAIKGLGAGLVLSALLELDIALWLYIFRR
jgi:hypothetical protein